MKTKQVLCISLITTMLFLLLTGCAGETTANNSSTTDAVAATVTKTNATEQTKETLMVLTASLPSYGSKYFTSMADPGNDKYIKKIEELTNIRLDITVRDHAKDEELVNLMFASGDIPDLFTYSNYVSHNSTIKQAVKNGIFMNLKPHINAENTPNLINQVPEEAWKESDELKDGSIYYVPVYQKAKCNWSLFIREDLLEKYKLEVPVSLDDFTNVLRVFKKNGVKYPLTARQNITNLDPIFGAFGVLIDRNIMTDEGKIEPAAIQPGMKEALRYLRGLYTEGLLDPEFLTNSMDPFTNKILNGDVGVFRHSANNYGTWQDGIVKNIPDAKFKMILAPIGPNGKGAMGPASASVIVPTYVNKNVKDPARIARFFDWMCTDGAAEIFSYGIEGDTYTKTADGKINFTYPTTTEGKDELGARTNTLWLVRDLLDNPLLSPYIPYNQLIVDYRAELTKTDNILHCVETLGSKLEIYQTSPELECNYNSSSLFQQIAIKIIFGKAEVDEFDNWVNDWKKRGGDKVLEQLEQKRATGEYTIY